MPPIDGPTTATTWSMPSFSFIRRYCDCTMSRMVNFGNCMRGCAFELLGEVERPLRDRIGADDEIFVGVQRLAGADQEVEPVVIARDRRHHQDGVGLLVVEFAVRDVGDRKILDHLAALELEVAFAVGLVRRLLRSMRRSRQRPQQSGGDDVSDAVHSVFSPWLTISARLLNGLMRLHTKPPLGLNIPRLRFAPSRVREACDTHVPTFFNGLPASAG